MNKSRDSFTYFVVAKCNCQKQGGKEVSVEERWRVLSCRGVFLPAAVACEQVPPVETKLLSRNPSS